MSEQLKTQSSAPQIFLSPEVRVVEASAGSGKTYALAKRYVQLLLNPKLHHEHIPLRNILAITFTNKAAFEMKARILEFLKKTALEELSPAAVENILTPVGIEPKTASRKAFAVMETLIRNYNFFQVQTIDKFINALLSGCAFKINLTANFRIRTNSAEYLEHSLDELIDSAGRDQKTAKIFENFLHQYLYLENRTGWFPKDDILIIVRDLFMQSNHYGLPFRRSGFEPEDLIKKKRQILEDIRQLREVLPEGTDKRFVKALDKFLLEHANGFDVDSLSLYFGRDDVPLNKGVEATDKVHRLWASLRKDFKSLVEEEAFSLFNPYIQIFDRVMAQFDELSSKDDVLFLEQLNKRAGELFGEGRVTVEELYYRLATRFHHYLMDEFQDTSRLQWHNLEKMAEEALSTGGTLFYVGDKKQAIYSFRGGDVKLFDQIKERFAAFNVQEEFLTNNWRSQKAVVEFNNKVFGPENLNRFINQKESYEDEKGKKTAVVFSEEDRQKTLDVFQNSQQTFQPQNSEGYVRVEFIDGEKKEDAERVIREKLVNLIKDLRKRFAYRDIAVLTRGNKEIEQMTNWLLEEGILVESERTLNVRENRLVQEIVAFLKFLDSPVDNVSFVDFILGDIFSAAAKIKKEEMHKFLFSLRDRLRSEKGLYVYTEFRKQYEDVWEEFIDGFFKNVGLYPLYELLVSIYSKFNCLNNFPQAQGFLMHLLDLIKKNEEDHSDIESFLKYFEQLEGDGLYVPIADSDAVRITTVHKSKGLEFPAVILPFLGMDIQVGTSSENQQSYVMREDDGAIDLLKLKEKYYLFSEGLYQVRRGEYKKAFLSELNTIYVALTRPQYELYAFVPRKIGGVFNFVQFLIPFAEGQVVYESGRQTTYLKTKAKNISIEKLPVSQYHDWIEYLRDEFLEFDLLANRARRLHGKAVHFILSKIGNVKGADMPKILARAVGEAGLEFEQFKDLSSFRAKVEEVLGAEQVKPFFFVDDGEVFTEQDIVTGQGHTKRLDRLIVKEKEVWVVDFKSSREGEERYQAQVREYMSLLSELHPAKKVSGYLIYLDKLEKVEVKMSNVKSQR